MNHYSCMKSHMKHLLCKVVVLIILFIPQLAQAQRTLYVANHGNDKNTGDANHPWRTVGFAVGKLKPGDRLLIRSGLYREAVDLKVSGTKDHPITIEGDGVVIFNRKGSNAYDPIFDTKGKNFISFKNLRVRDARAGVHVNQSHDIKIDNIKVQYSHFAVLMTDASNVSIKNCWAKNNRNAFRGEGKTHDVTIENVRAFYSKDIYKGYDLNYLNGDGFIFEAGTYNLTFKKCISAFHWDSGFDIKGKNVVLNNVIAVRNKNGLKLWGQNIRVTNALVYGSKSQKRPDGSKVDGIGVNVRKGNAEIYYSTIANNEAQEVKVAKEGKLAIEKSIIYRAMNKGSFLGAYGAFSSHSVIWFNPNGKRPINIPKSQDNMWVDPQFVDWRNNNYRLKFSSPAYASNPPMGAYFPSLKGRLSLFLLSFDPFLEKEIGSK